MYKNIIAANNYVAFFKDTIKLFGGVKRGNNKYIMRENVNDSLNQSGAYFGCITEDEEPSGPYTDLSIAVFPSNEPNDSEDKWIVALVVGSLGFKNDYNLVSIPGTRRMFVNCLSKDSFIKNEFIDIESRDGFSGFCDKNDIPETLKNAIKNYHQMILACSLFDPNNKSSGENTIRTFLAIYAELRKWPSNNGEKDYVKAATQNRKSAVDEKREIENLLKNRKYVVLQGAPGTGKTRMAKNLVLGQAKVQANIILQKTNNNCSAWRMDMAELFERYVQSIVTKGTIRNTFGYDNTESNALEIAKNLKKIL